jgi:hypothetical protein
VEHGCDQYIAPTDEDWLNGGDSIVQNHMPYRAPANITCGNKTKRELQIIIETLRNAIDITALTNSF